MISGLVQGPQDGEVQTIWPPLQPYSTDSTTCLSAQIYAYMYICLYIYTHIYVCMYVRFPSIFMYIHTHMYVYHTPTLRNPGPDLEGPRGRAPGSRPACTPAASAGKAAAVRPRAVPRRRLRAQAGLIWIHV